MTYISNTVLMKTMKSFCILMTKLSNLADGQKCIKVSEKVMMLILGNKYFKIENIKDHYLEEQRKRSLLKYLFVRTKIERKT